jgi:hypothetical protein
MSAVTMAMVTHHLDLQVCFASVVRVALLVTEVFMVVVAFRRNRGTYRCADGTTNNGATTITQFRSDHCANGSTSATADGRLGFVDLARQGRGRAQDQTTGKQYKDSAHFQLLSCFNLPSLESPAIRLCDAIH